MEESESQWRTLFETVGEELMVGVDYYNLDGLPDHVRKKLDRILTSTTPPEAEEWARKARDSFFMHRLAHGQPKNKQFYLGLAAQAEGRAKSYRNRGWDSAAESHEAKAKEFRILAESAPVK